MLLTTGRIRAIDTDDIRIFTDPSLSPGSAKIQRKRALFRRYNSWASTKRFIGPAGESAVASSLVASGAMQLPNQGSEVAEVLGFRFDGPLDNGGYLTVIAPDNPAAYTALYCPIEVKNVREWIYPHSSLLHQLPDKAAQLQEHVPDFSIHPILICRRCHYTTFFMAATQLGFKVMELERQYLDSRAIRGDNGDQHLSELRAELGMLDLVPLSADVESQGDKVLTKWFRTSLPKFAADAAAAWRRTVLDERLHDTFGLLRHEHEKDHGARNHVMAELRRRAVETGLQGGW
ncbi:hypothetical protein GTV32_01720 [Gordonia sp. SID5947]|uniref:hypothetical protein n=1 Tax=Gordonia sp. SID5947 TaxID=2690315 RepID=UPI00136E9EA7|nr:hypothetical protein [Gordonia sp. SID5947]MYR05128.1 hypothetical protein [Gordonia sp. SID5947]